MSDLGEPSDSEPVGRPREARLPPFFWRFFVMVLVLPLVAAAAWKWGRGYSAVRPVQAFQVHGSSMAPTLVGQHHMARCDVCRLSWRVEPAHDFRRQSLRCWHCSGDATITAAVRSADVIQVHELPCSELQSGDVVAVRWDGRIRIKRVLALPGDVVELDGLLLVVNGDRMNERSPDPPIRLPQFLVDDDQRRVSSRWTAESSSSWQRTTARTWEFIPADTRAHEMDWLVYQHESVHDGNLCSPVWDDYPFNVSIRRRLHVVDRFIVRGLARCHTPTRLIIALWSREGSRTQQISLPPGEHPFVVRSMQATVGDDVAMTAERPVAIRSDQPIEILGLKIERPALYRLNPYDARGQYPLTIPANKLFVVGDNVPVSVDSRDRGLIAADEVLGRVTKVTAAEH